MQKPLLGLILGGILGVLDGLSALFYPEAAPQILSIITFSGLKGLIAGVIIGFFASKIYSIGKGLVFGAAVGLILAFIVAAFPDESGQHYYIEIMAPGTLVGLILGFATQRFGKRAKVVSTT